jgi:hypothetical protein
LAEPQAVVAEQVVMVELVLTLGLLGLLQHLQVHQGFSQVEVVELVTAATMEPEDLVVEEMLGLLEQPTPVEVLVELHLAVLEMEMLVDQVSV